MENPSSFVYLLHSVIYLFIFFFLNTTAAKRELKSFHLLRASLSHIYISISLFVCTYTIMICVSRCPVGPATFCLSACFLFPLCWRRRRCFKCSVFVAQLYFGVQQRSFRLFYVWFSLYPLFLWLRLKYLFLLSPGKRSFVNPKAGTTPTFQSVARPRSGLGQAVKVRSTHSKCLSVTFSVPAMNLYMFTLVFSLFTSVFCSSRCLCLQRTGSHRAGAVCPRRRGQCRIFVVISVQSVLSNLNSNLGVGLSSIPCIFFLFEKWNKREGTAPTFRRSIVPLVKKLISGTSMFWRLMLCSDSSRNTHTSLYISVKLSVSTAFENSGDLHC